MRRVAGGLLALRGGSSRLLAGLWLAAVLMLCGSPALAQQGGRVALVVGQTNYDTGALPTTANDAGLMVQTLRSAGFDVVEGADLELDALRRSVREFMDKVEAAGPQAEAVVYWTGHGVQFEGENWFVPVGARIARASDIPMESFRVADLIRSLAALPARARIVILDAARPFPALRDNQALAPGLTLIEPPDGFAIAFSAAPDAIAPDGRDPYGPYATALVEMMGEPGLSVEELFGRVRVRVHELTQGRQTPWDSVRLTEPFSFFAAREGVAAAPPPAPARHTQAARPSAAGSLRPCPAARRHRDVSGVLACFPARSQRQPHQAHPRAAARGGGLAADRGAEHAGILLDLPEAVSRRPACAGCGAPPASPLRAAAPAAAL